MVNKYGSAMSISLIGINGKPVKVETDISMGLPRFTIIGLPDLSLKEAKYRVNSAFNYCNLGVHAGNITVNLSPACLYKTGSGFDLAIAISILCADKKIDFDKVKNWMFISELGLDGKLYPVNGILPMVNAAVKNGYKNIVVAKQCEYEAKLVDGSNIFPADNLVEVLNYFGGSFKVPQYDLEKNSYDGIEKYNLFSPIDMSEIKGNTLAKYGLEVAACGGHNVFMLGTAGSGKTMLAKSMCSILPELSKSDSLDVSSIYSVAGKNIGGRLIKTPPFYAPHHSATLPSLIGGGTNIKPGAISLAHKGILFIDEAGEFPARALDSLRQPLEDKYITISRVNSIAVYPADFQLLLASNPCPCGNFASKTHECKCSAYQVNKYMSKISGPLLDRVDIQLRVQTQKRQTFDMESEEKSETILSRVIEARKRILLKYKDINVSISKDLLPKHLRSSVSKIDGDGYLLVESQISKGKLSMRGADKVLRLGVSIAALDGCDVVSQDHIAQALILRTNINE
ncbi:YifB family Mg chelatase-like AAA ATPase [Actinomyces sp. zg-332]|uniref:YifB family Mg chelatase-like AAA ATPase n=1 Tax=Actinomyces sp. zg-332 TaxID=2708340 RepID=UPI00141EBD04|nr:YifB family Mg chelatase-like AAA ATPase [Actinomyces sp. zg-332]QPK94681.1 YifB family Mg chelatase-like AAA ATPase [Actinomyces sp. zg-332]